MEEQPNIQPIPDPITQTFVQENNVDTPNQSKKSQKWLIFLLILLLLTVVATASLYLYINNKPKLDQYQKQNAPATTSQEFDNADSIKLGNAVNLTNDNVHQMLPVLYKNKIAWVDLGDNKINECKKGDLAHQPCISQIFIYDIETRKAEQLTNTQTWKSILQLTDDYVHWSEQPNQVEYGSGNNILLNLKTGDKTVQENAMQLTENNNTILREGYNAYLVNLVTGKKKLILSLDKAGGPYDTYGKIQVSGNYMIWEEGYWKPGGENGVIVYGKKIDDESGKREITSFKSTSGYSHSIPKIFKNKVVWEEYEKENPETKNLGAQYYAIYIFNIDTGEKKQIISKKGGQSGPDIYDKYLVYADRLSQSYKFLNLVINETQTISIKNTGPGQIQIGNNHAVWQDGPSIVSYTGEIYLLDLP